MPKGFMPVNARSVAEERRLREIVQSTTITKKSTKKIEALYEKYRLICMKIRVRTGIKRFRGTYDEVLDIYQTYQEPIPQDLDKLLDMWRVMDSAIKVEASKLGYTGDRWLKNCWGEEIAKDAIKFRH
jgi:hypothetical protein